MITTLCLAGASAKPRIDDKHLGGELFKSPFQRRDILYSNGFVATANYNDGRAKAKAALIASSGEVVMCAHSLGARIAGSLMDDAEVLAACPPSRCVFVLTGHPERKYGGAATVQHSGILSGYSYTGIPDDVQYRVWDVANQHAIMEDHPQDRSVRAAVENASLALHMDYTTTLMGDPRNTVWADPENPNVTYILAPTYPLPSIESRWWSLQRKADEDAKQRAQIEKGYSRPFPAPTTKINRLWSTDFGYDAATRRYVRIPAAAPWNPFRGQGV